MLPPPTNLIVVVDDNKDDVYLFRQLLRNTGLQNRVVPILDGADALAFFERAASSGGGVVLPLICFLDVRMAGTDGFDVLRWIRRNPSLDRMPVIMMSVLDDSRHTATAASLGAQCYLRKFPTALALRDSIKHGLLYAAGFGAPHAPLFGFPANLLTRRHSAEARSEPVD